jgi:hypothetical protein
MGGDLKFDNLLLIAIIVIVLYCMLSSTMCNKQKTKTKENFAGHLEMCGISIFTKCDDPYNCDNKWAGYCR